MNLSFLFFKHDTNSPQDGGSLIGEPETYHWFPPPTQRDVRVELTPEVVRLRPWHRWGFGSPKARITVSNWSYMELGVKPQVYRGETPDHGAKVSKLPEYALAPETSISLPVTIRLNPRERNENFTLCADAAVTPPREASPAFVAPCEQQTFVDYVPFRHLWWYDYPLLIGGGLFVVCALVWLFRGIPENAGATVNLQLKSPPGMVINPKDIQSVELLSHRDAIEKKYKGLPLGDNVYQFVLPKRYIWYRWPFGWSGSSLETEPYDLLVDVSSTMKEHFTVGHQEAVDLSYVSERRKFHDHNYVVPCAAELKLDKLPEKPKDLEKPKDADKALRDQQLLEALKLHADATAKGKGGNDVEPKPPHVGKTTDEGKMPDPKPGHRPGTFNHHPKQEQHPSVNTDPGQHLTPEETKALCIRAGLHVLRTDNPLHIDLEAHPGGVAQPSVVSFVFPPKAGYFQLYSVRGNEPHPLLCYIDKSEEGHDAVLRVPDPEAFRYEMAWQQSDIPAATEPLPQDDMGVENTDVEYILLAVSADVPLTKGDRKDLRTYVNTHPHTKWSIVNWKAHQNAVTTKPDDTKGP